MIANFFNKPNPLNTIVLVVSFLIIYAVSTFMGVVVFSWFTIPLCVFSFGLSGFIKSRNNLTFNNTFAGLFLIILIGFFPKVMVINKIFAVNLLLLFALRKIYGLQFLRKTKNKVFDASFWLGISFLLEPISAIFILLLYLVMFLYDLLDIKTFIISIFGFSIPVFLFFTYCFWFDKTEQFISLFNQFTNIHFDFYKTPEIIYKIVFILIFILGAIGLKTLQLFKIITSFRNTWGILILNFILALILAISSPYRNGNELLYLFFPVAIILANGFEIIQKHKVSDVVLILFFIVLLTSILFL